MQAGPYLLTFFEEELDWIVYDVSTRGREVWENEAVTDDTWRGTCSQPYRIQRVLGGSMTALV